MKTKKSLSIVLALMSCAFMFTSLMSYGTPERAKNPPGTCIVNSYCQENIAIIAVATNSFDVCPDYGLQLHAFGILSSEQWEPKTTFIGFVITAIGKPQPKPAIQILYGLQDDLNVNQRLC